MIDFTTLEPPSSPNTYLICPPGFCRDGAPDERSTVIDVDAATLIEAWLAVVAKAPRTSVVERSADGLGVTVEQKSRLFKFVDRIHARAVPLDGGGAALAVYSSSDTGYYDFGVNKKRVLSWSAQAVERAKSAS